MTDYGLHLESGPKRRTTMVHVPELLGCVANGPTTEAALEATPAAIRAFLRLLQRHGEAVDPEAPLQTHVVEHITEGAWLGNGSPYLLLSTDTRPLDGDEIEVHLHRFQAMRDELSAWVATQTERQLDARPASGRTKRAIVLHVMGAAIGGYLSAALGGSKGFSAVQGAAERGEIPLADGLQRIAAMTVERVRETTAEQRRMIRDRGGGDKRTLRKALRRILEHDWEHLAELSRRPGGPPL
jgi:predicted RNase H-like HicB family nuclease